MDTNFSISENYITVLKNYKTFTGRAKRKEFWYYALVNWIIAMFLAIFAFFIKTTILNTIFTFATLVPSVAVGIRRMHDVGKSGWFLLIPFYNLYLAVIKTENRDNEYGANPNQ